MSSFQKVTTAEDVLRSQGISDELLGFGSPSAYSPMEQAAPMQQNNYQYDQGNSWYQDGVKENQQMSQPKQEQNNFRPVSRDTFAQQHVPIDRRVQANSPMYTPVAIPANHQHAFATIKTPTLQEQLTDLSPSSLQEVIRKSQELLLHKTYGSQASKLFQAIDELAKNPNPGFVVLSLDPNISKNVIPDLFSLAGSTEEGELVYANKHGVILTMVETVAAGQESVVDNGIQTQIQNLYDQGNVLMGSGEVAGTQQETLEVSEEEYNIEPLGRVQSFAPEAGLFNRSPEEA